MVRMQRTADFGVPNPNCHMHNTTLTFMAQKRLRRGVGKSIKSEDQISSPTWCLQSTTRRLHPQNLSTVLVWTRREKTTQVGVSMWMGEITLAVPLEEDPVEFNGWWEKENQSYPGMGTLVGCTMPNDQPYTRVHTSSTKVSCIYTFICILYITTIIKQSESMNLRSGGNMGAGTWRRGGINNVNTIRKH